MLLVTLKKQFSFFLDFNQHIIGTFSNSLLTSRYIMSTTFPISIKDFKKKGDSTSLAKFIFDKSMLSYVIIT